MSAKDDSFTELGTLSHSRALWKAIDPKDRYQFVCWFQGNEKPLDHVYQAIDIQERKTVVVKRAKTRLHLKKEYAANCRLRHTHIAEMLNFFWQDNFYFVFDMKGDMELFEWTHLYHETFDYIDYAGQTEMLALHFAKQLREAMQYCHSQGVAHRDLKLENIRINRKKRKLYLVDFGLAYVSDITHDGLASCGTIYYAPPELLSADYELINPYKTDVWCFANCIYAVAHMKMPYGIDTKTLEQTKIVKPDAVYSKEFCDAIMHMLRLVPSARPSFRRLGQYSWFKQDCEIPNDFVFY
jgi:serine/threonine protein kinase